MSLKHRHPGAVSSSSEDLLVPMASTSDRGKSPRFGKSSSSSLVSTLPLLLASMAIAAGSTFLVCQTVRTNLENRLQALMQSKETETTAMKHEFDLLVQEKNKLEQELANAQAQVVGLSTNTEEEKKMREEIDYLIEYKKDKALQIQQYSKARLLEKFGPGPHRVEIQLDIDPASNIANEPGGDRIVIEMAPVDEMPHTVYWFLSQVDRGLYNGASFHRNAGHVVQGGPTANFATPPDLKLAKNFQQAGFNSVLFQEYSPKFPHYKHTLGYAGRPGGPDFYISTKDNVRNHGPGGQSSYADPGEADPCFAKVIEGDEAVDRMAKSTVKQGGYRRMEHYVGIRHMKLLPHEDVAQAET